MTSALDTYTLQPPTKKNPLPAIPQSLKHLYHDTTQSSRTQDGGGLMAVEARQIVFYSYSILICWDTVSIW